MSYEKVQRATHKTSYWRTPYNENQLRTQQLYGKTIGLLVMVE